MSVSAVFILNLVLHVQVQTSVLPSIGWCVGLTATQIEPTIGLAQNFRAMVQLVQLVQLDENIHAEVYTQKGSARPRSRASGRMGIVLT